MSVGTTTAAYPGVAHGALNWDTQLRGDVSGLSNQANGLVGALGTFGYNATVVNFGSNWNTRLQVSGNQVTFNLGCNPGANGFTTGSSNNTVGTIPTGTSPLLFRPLTNVAMPVLVYNNGGGIDGTGWVIIGPDGSVKIAALPTSQVLNGGAVLGTAAWPAQ